MKLFRFFFLTKPTVGIGLSTLLLWMGAPIRLGAQTLTSVYSFGSQSADGQQPVAGLVQGSDGNFYGTTNLGGANNLGTIFRITPNGPPSILYSFCSQSGCADGQYVYASIIQGSDGKFYGTTGYGGSPYSNAGTVFSFTPSGTGGTLNWIYQFCPTGPPCADGQNPYTAPLVQGSDGNFYGTTRSGGDDNQGTIFRITPQGTLTKLYSFCSQGGTSCTDGAFPAAGLVQDSAGNLYGTTLNGGSPYSNAGTVFSFTPSATAGMNWIYQFCPYGPQSPCTDGEEPWANLVIGPDGDLYGETYNGGSGAASGGTIFKITTTGTLSTLYSFCKTSGYCTDGAQPRAGLVLGIDGNFYGTTYYGGSNNLGTLFKITPTGNLTWSYSFAGADGANPIDGLIQASDGAFYGTTYGGGSRGFGTIFRLSPIMPLTITADNQNRMYATANPTLTFTPTGLLNNDTLASLGVTVTCSTSATASSSVGSYPITCTGPSSASNYTITYPQGSLTINPVSLTIAANNTNRVYGVANPAFTSAPSGLLNGDTLASIGVNATCVTTATISSPVGRYPITCSGPLSTTNYSIAYQGGSLTITVASLTITANDAGKTLDAPNPAFTAAYSGFVGSDAPASLSGTLNCTSTAATVSPVGSYPITCSGQSSANYNVNYVPGTLKISYASGSTVNGSPGHQILPPINADGTSVYKQGRIIPVQFRVGDANGVSIGTPGVVSSFFLTEVITGTVTTNVENVVDTSNPDAAFRWDAANQQWIFNITTKSLSAGSTYVYTITLNDGSTISFQLGLR